jgi:hypothetical protein
MAILVLDRSTGPLPPYGRWLGDSAQDVVLFTARSRRDIAEHDSGGLTEVRHIKRYVTGAEADIEALRLAQRTELSAIVATASDDAIRAGALRDHLRLGGQGREDAIVLADLPALRQRLNEAGISTMPCGLVRRPADVFWHAHRFGYPVGARQSRADGWPTISVLHSQVESAAFTSGDFAADFRWMPAVMLEPRIAGARCSIGAVATGPGVTPAPAPAGAPHPPEAMAAMAALAALPTLTGARYRVELVRASTGEWLIDSVGLDLLDPGARRAAVRAQAGLRHDSAAVMA